MKNVPRIAWIDAIKGIGIVSVAAGHHPSLWEYSETLGKAMFSFPMPLFFFISGLTLTEGMRVNTLRMRAISCLVPYLFLSVISVPFLMFLHRDAQLIDLLAGIAYGTGHTMYTVPLWFLPCLVLSLCIVFALDRAALLLGFGKVFFHPVMQVITFVLLQAGWQATLTVDRTLANQIGWGSWPNSGAFWSADIALTGASYILLGRGFAKYLGQTPQASKLNQRLVVILGALFIATNLIFEPALDFNLRQDSPAFFSAITAIAGTLTASFLAISIKNRLLLNVFKRLGTSTILILWLHATLEMTFFRLLGKHLDGFSTFAISLLLSLILPVVLDALMRRFSWMHALVVPGPAAKRLLAPRRPSNMPTPQSSVE